MPPRTPEGAALFERDGGFVVPTQIARGPWRRDALHGGAVAALLATALDLPGRTPVRTVFDLLGPVPNERLRLRTDAAEGGQRVQRQTVTLHAGDRLVARAQALGIRQIPLDVPAHERGLPDPFADVPPPELDRPRPQIGEAIGWEGFDSAAVSVRRLPTPSHPAGATCLYVNLLVPVIAGEPVAPLARAAAAADYASSDLNTVLSFDSWTFMNAELTLHLARVPQDSWVGVVSTALAGPDGGGLGMAALFDPAGRLGQCGQALVVEARERVVSTT